MNTSSSQDTIVVGQTGTLDSADSEPANLKSTGLMPEYPSVSTMPETGHLVITQVEGVQPKSENSDGSDDLEQFTYKHLRTEQIFMEGTIAQIKMRVMDECEQHYLRGLVTGSGQSDILNHVLYHFENDISLAIWVASISMDPEYNEIGIVRTFFERIKLIVQTYVEYLHFVKGVEWYELKAFIANVSLTLKDNLDTKNPRANNTLFSFFNSFLPELIGSIKENHINDLSPFSRRLEGILVHMNKNRPVLKDGQELTEGIRRTSFEQMCANDDFREALDQFCSEYLTIDSTEFKRIIYTIYARLVMSEHFTNKPVEAPVNDKAPILNSIPSGFVMLRKLTSKEFIGNNMDFFINSITRTIRLGSYPSMLTLTFESRSQELMKGLRYGLDLSSTDSRQSIYSTRKKVEAGVDSRVASAEVPADVVTVFNERIDESINSITILEDTVEDASQQQLLKLYDKSDNVIDIADPVGVVRIFISIFESSILLLDDELFIRNGETVSDESIERLLESKFEELETKFNQNIERGGSINLNSIEYYFLLFLGRTHDEILTYINETYEDETYKLAFDKKRMLQEYIPSLRKKIKAKMAIASPEGEPETTEQAYRRYVLEVLVGIVRPNLYYYADTMDEFCDDYFATLRTDSDISKLVIRLLSRISQESRTKFMKVNLPGEGISNVDLELLANSTAYFIEKNERLKLAVRRILGIHTQESIAYRLRQYFRTPNLVASEA